MLSPAHRLYLLFTPSLAGDKPWRVLENALKGGVDLVQWRSKESDDAGFRACRDVCMARSVPIFVNDDVMLAVRGRAHGARGAPPSRPPTTRPCQYALLLAVVWLASLLAGGGRCCCLLAVGC